MAQISTITLLNFLFTVFCLVNAEQKRTLSEKLYAQKYLKQYHYLSPLEAGNHDLKTALEIYQRFMHLPVTGNLDDVTYREMEIPRCGFPDIEEDDDTGSETSSGIGKRFGVSSKPWGKTALTYAFENYGEDMSQVKFESVIAKAFKLWSDNSVLTFTKVLEAKNADIKIAFGRNKHANCNFDFDGPGNILAHANFPEDGRLHFDEDETFTDGVSTGTNLFSITVHEIGHIIGISHSTLKQSVMHPEYKGYNANLQLDADDINGAAYLYGGGTVKPKHTQPANCTDLYGVCQNNKHNCKVAMFQDAMKKNCPATCGLCAGGAGNIQPCIDVYAKYFCTLYKNKGYCNHKKIKPNCRKTCSTTGSC